MTSVDYKKYFLQEVEFSSCLYFESQIDYVISLAIFLKTCDMVTIGPLYQRHYGSTYTVSVHGVTEYVEIYYLPPIECDRDFPKFPASLCNE